MRKCGAIFGCALAALLLAPATPVAAHAVFIESTPVDGSVLVKAPSVAELRFSEDVLASASTVRLLHLGSGETDDLHVTVTDGGQTVHADLPVLPRGAFVLQYVVIDPVDLHKTVGSISFGIGVAAPPSLSGSQVDASWLAIALRGVTDSAVMMCVGGVVVAILLVRIGRRDLREVARLADFAGRVIAVGWIGLLVTDAASVGFGTVRWGSLVLQSDPGRRAVVGVQLAFGMWWAARLLQRAVGDEARRFIARIMACIAGGFVLAVAYGGHAGVGGSFALGVALRAAHLGSLSVWIGSLAALALLLRRDRSVGELWPKVSRLAAIGLAIAGASGLLLSGRVAMTVTALFGSSYGRELVVKAGLLVALAGLGWMGALRVSRGREPTRLPLELSIAGVAVLIAAVLASSAPARGEQYLPLPSVNPQIVTEDVRDLTVSASIEPARPGANLVQLRVLDRSRPSPGPVETVRMRIRSADGSIVAERNGVPALGVVEWPDVEVPSPGTYQVDVDITRSALPVPSFTASWDVDVLPVPRAATILSTRRWAPFASVMAVAWVALVAVGFWGVRRRRPLRQPSLNQVADR